MDLRITKQVNLQGDRSLLPRPGSLRYKCPEVRCVRKVPISLYHQANTPGDADCEAVNISADGKFVVFHSNAQNLTGTVPASTSNVYLAFNPLWDLQERPTPTPTPTPTPYGAPTPTPTPEDTNPGYHEDVQLPIEGASDEDIRDLIENIINSIVKKNMPAVTLTGKKAEVVFNNYIITALENSPLVRAAADYLSAKKGKLKLRYKVVLTGKSKRAAKKRRIVRKNRVVFKRLKPGRYTVKYRVVIKRKKKVIAKTDYSPAADFSIN